MKGTDADAAMAATIAPRTTILNLLALLSNLLIRNFCETLMIPLILFENKKFGKKDSAH